MANLTSVVYASGTLAATNTGTVSTVDQLIAVGLPIAQGGNTAVVKAGSTTVTSSDPALVVQISPNGVNANGQATMGASAPVVLPSDFVGTFGFMKKEDVASGTGDAGIPAMAIQQPNPADTADTAGDYAMLQMSAGQIWTNNGRQQPGTNGFMATPFTLFSSNELSGLATLATVTSSASGSSGKFSQTDTKGCRQGVVYLNCAGAFTAAAGGCLTGWFLFSPDGGSTIEHTTAATNLARAPDFVIPLNNVATASGDIYAGQWPVQLPWSTFKVYLQNNTGTTLSANNHTILLAPVS